MKINVLSCKILLFQDPRDYIWVIPKDREAYKRKIKGLRYVSAIDLRVKLKVEKDGVIFRPGDLYTDGRQQYICINDQQGSEGIFENINKVVYHWEIPKELIFVSHVHEE